MIRVFTLLLLISFTCRAADNCSAWESPRYVYVLSYVTPELVHTVGGLIPLGNNRDLVSFITGTHAGGNPVLDSAYLSASTDLWGMIEMARLALRLNTEFQGLEEIIIYRVVPDRTFYRLLASVESAQVRHRDDLIGVTASVLQQIFNLREQYVNRGGIAEHRIQAAMFVRLTNNGGFEIRDWQTLSGFRNAIPTINPGLLELERQITSDESIVRIAILAAFAPVQYLSCAEYPPPDPRHVSLKNVPSNGVCTTKTISELLTERRKNIAVLF